MATSTQKPVVPSTDVRNCWSTRKAVKSATKQPEKMRSDGGGGRPSTFFSSASGVASAGKGASTGGVASASDDSSAAGTASDGAASPIARKFQTVHINEW